MLFCNFLCLFYLMVLTRCHTISKSIASYDQLDDTIDSVNDYPLSTVFNARHERIHPKYRRAENAKTTEFGPKAPETTTKSKEKNISSLMTKATKRKETNKTRTTLTTEATKPVPTVPIDNAEKPTMNLLRRIQHKFSWRNRTSVKDTTKKRRFKFHKKHKDTTTKDKVDRDKRVALYDPLNEIDRATSIFSNFETTPETIPNNYAGIENIMTNIKVDNEGENTSPPFTSPADVYTQKAQDFDDIYRGTAGIEAMLNKIKIQAINIISQQSDSVGEIITNSVTETTFEADPVLHAMAVKKHTPPNDFDFKDVINFAEPGEENMKACVASMPKDAQPKPHADTLGYNLEYKLEKEMKYALMKAKDTLTGGLNKARDQVKSVTWKIMHNTAGKLSDIANKLEIDENSKEVPFPEQGAVVKPSQMKTLTTPPLVTKPPLTKPPKLQTLLKQNFTSTTSPTSTKKLVKISNKNKQTTRRNKGRSTANMSSQKKKDAEDGFSESQDDYSMLKIYEKVLFDKESTMGMLMTPMPGHLVKYFKVSKRDIETIENLNLKDTISKINDGEGMPNADYNNNYRKPSAVQIQTPSVEVSNDGNTLKMTETSLRELTSPDNSFIGLTNKIHYNEYINGYKHYLNFARDLSKFDRNYSNLVRYQAHRHHSVDDIGRFILTRLPTIPEWRMPPEFYKSTQSFKNTRREKRVPLFEELEMEAQETTKNKGSWFKRHFDIFRDSDSKKKFHTEQTVPLKSEVQNAPKEKINKEAPSMMSKIWKYRVDDKSELGEKEGLKFRWKTYKPITKITEKASSHGPSIAPGQDTSEPPLMIWSSENKKQISKTIDAIDKPDDSYPPPSKVDLNELIKRMGDVSEMTNNSYSIGENPTTDSDLNDLIKKLDNMSASMIITKIYPEPTTISDGATNFNIQLLLRQISTTNAPSEALYLNELVSALLLRNCTAENSVKKLVLDSPHYVINKLLNRPNRVEKYNKKDEDAIKDDSLQEFSRAKRDKKNSYVPKEEFEHIRKSTIPTNVLEDAALYPQQGHQNMEFDKFGYVNLDLVAKPITPVQQKKKSKYNKFLDKFKSKKNNDKGKYQKLDEKSRKTRHSPFKMLKNLFKSVQTDPNDSIYETTEPFSYKFVKYAEMQRSLNEFMKQVPNISKDEVTYKPYLSSINFQPTPIDALMNPVLAAATSTTLVPSYTVMAAPTTYVRQEIKKKQYKPLNIENDFSMPFNFRNSPTAEHKLSPTLHVTLTPITLDELMKELRVNMYNDKLKNIKITSESTVFDEPKTFITRHLAVDGPTVTRITKKPAPKVSKLNFRTHFDNIPSKDVTRFFRNNNYTTIYAILDDDFKRHGVKNMLYENDEKQKGLLLHSIQNPELENLDFNHIEKLFYDINNQHFDKDKEKNIDNFGYDVNENIDENQYVNALYEKADISQDEIQSTNINSYYRNKEIATEPTLFYSVENDKYERKDDNQFLNMKTFGYNRDITTNDLKNYNSYKSEFKDLNLLQRGKDYTTDSMHLQNIKNNDRDGIQFQTINLFDDDTTETQTHSTTTPQNVKNNYDDQSIQFEDINLFDDDTTETQSQSTKKLRRDQNLKNNEYQFRTSKTTTRRNNDNESSSTGSDDTHGFKYNVYDTKQPNEDKGTLNSISTKVQNSALVLRKSKGEDNKYKSEVKSTKPYKITKPYKSYPDYFGDFFNWNRDILSLDRVTDQATDVMDILMNVTDVDVRKLRDEILKMQNYLKDMTSQQNTRTTKMRLKMPSPTMQKNMTAPRRDSKVNKRGHSNDNTKLQSLDQLNQMVDDINKLYRQSFNKNDMPGLGSSKGNVKQTAIGSVLTTLLITDDITQSPIMDTTILAYNDALNILTDDFETDMDSNTPKIARSKTKNKVVLSSKIKVSPSPEQYFRTPVPMQPSDFDQFLKDHDLFIPNITSPYSELSQFEEDWEKGHHVKSKLMDTRGKHENFFDVPKMLKDINGVDFTPNRIIIKPSEISCKIYTKKRDNIQYKASTIIEENAAQKSPAEFSYLDDAEYIGIKNDGVGTRPQIENYNIDDSIKIKRKSRPFKLKKTSTIAPFNNTTAPNLNFDITIIDIDDIMSISQADNLELQEQQLSKMAKANYTSPATQTITTEKPKPILEPNITGYNSLDIDPEPDPFDMMPDHYPEQYNAIKPSNNHEEENALNKNEHIVNAYKHPEDGFIKKNIFKFQANQKHKTKLEKKASSKYKPTETTDSAKSEYFLNSFGTKVNRKFKSTRGKKKHDKNFDNSNLHNDLLYSFNVEQFMGTTSEQTFLPTKRPMHFVHDEFTPKQSEKSSAATKTLKLKTAETETDDNPEKIERFLNTQRESNLHPQMKPWNCAKCGDDLFSEKPKIGSLPNIITPGPTLKFRQKFRKQPDRILFSSHTLKYDVFYDDVVKTAKSHYKGPQLDQAAVPDNAQMTSFKPYFQCKPTIATDSTLPKHFKNLPNVLINIDLPTYYLPDRQITETPNKTLRKHPMSWIVRGKEYRTEMFLVEVSRSNASKDGGDGVEHSLGEVLGGNKGDRRRRKAMWRKWKTASNVPNSTSTKKTTSETPVTRKWFRFMTMKTQKATTTPTSTSSILILSNNSTSSPILLSSTGSSHLIDGNRREQRDGDSGVIYNLDVTNDNDKVSSTTAATEADTESPFPKTGDITFIYPAQIINNGGKPKLFTKEKTYVEQDWGTILKTHIPRFRPFFKLKVGKNEKKVTYPNMENPDETYPWPIKSQDTTRSFMNEYVEEKKYAELDDQDPSLTLPIPATILPSTDFTDISKMKDNLLSNWRDSNEFVEKTTTEKPSDVFNSEMFAFTLSDSTNVADQEFDPNLAQSAHGTKLDKRVVTYVSSCCFGGLPALTTLKASTKTKTQTTVDMTELGQEIANIEKEMENRKSKPTTSEQKVKTLQIVHDNARKIAAANQAAKEAKVAAESTAGIQQDVDEKKLADMEKSIKAQEAAEARQIAEARQLSDDREISKEVVRAKQIAEKKKVAEAKKAAKAKAAAQKAAKKIAALRKKTKKTTTQTSRMRPVTDRIGQKAKLTSQQTSSATKSLTKPTELTTPNSTKSTSSTTQTKKTMTTQEAKSKNLRSRLIKRETPETFNTIYTAKDVAALEVIVDLMKEPADGMTSKEKSKTVKYHDKYDHPNTNAIQVHIALPYQMEDRKRAAEPTKLRKVFAARMSVPVDIEYQVRSLDVGHSTRKSCHTNSDSCISPGMYLLVEDTQNNKGFALKPMVRQVTPDFISSTVKTTSPEDVARVVLSKDYIQSINKQLIQLYKNLSSANQTTEHTIKKRYAKSGQLRNRRIINWDEVKKIFVSSDRVCDCKCIANQTMCRACAASDAVMTELLFEFENLAQYMNDHCTELQSYFWMNPSGGRRLRDVVHKIDQNINDYYKRVKGKCRGRPCNAFDKREITMPYVRHKGVYIGTPLLNDIENLDKSLQEAQKLKLVCSKELKNIVDQLVQISVNCTKNNRFKRIASEQKKTYSLDNINVNIICNQDSSFQTETSSVYDLLTTEYPVLDYTDDEVKKKTRKSLKKLFVKRKRKNSHKKASKRDTIVQIESPLSVYDARDLWKEYLKVATKTTTVQPVITLDVLEKTDEHTVTFNPRLKATLVKMVTGNSSTSNSNNEVLLHVSDPYRKRVSRQDYLYNIDDLTTKPHISKEMRELLKLFEPDFQENKGKSGFFKRRFAKATQTLKLNTPISSTKETNSMTEKVKEISSSVATIKVTNATLPGEVTPFVNVTSVGTTPVISINPDVPYDEATFKEDSNIQNNQTTTKSTNTNKTKESWFHKLKSIITPGYVLTQKPKVTNKLHHQQELPSMNANIDVNSDMTTTSYPTLFIIEDLPNDAKTSDYENLLIKIMEYERNRLDSELTKHKMRENNKVNVGNEINDVLVFERNKDLRVVTPLPTSKLTVKNPTVDTADGDYCILNTWKKWSGFGAVTTTTTIKTTTTTQKQSKTLVQMLLQSLKKNSQKAGKEPMNSLVQLNPQPEKMKTQKHAAEMLRDLQTWLEPETEEEPAITLQEPIQTVGESVLTQKQQSQPETASTAKCTQIQQLSTGLDNNQQLNFDNGSWFLAQFASTIIFTNTTDYRGRFYPFHDKGTEQANTYMEDNTLYSSVTDPVAISIDSPKTNDNGIPDPDTITIDSPKTNDNGVPDSVGNSKIVIKTTLPTNYGYIKGPVSIDTKVTVIPYAKTKKTTDFSLDVTFNKGQVTKLSKLKNKLLKHKSFASNNITASTSTLVPTTSFNESTTIETTTKSTAPEPITTEKQNTNDIEEDEQEVYAEVLEPIKTKPETTQATTTITITSSSKTTDKIKNKVVTQSDKGKTNTLSKPSDPKLSKFKLSEAKSKKEKNKSNRKEEKTAEKLSNAKPKNKLNKINQEKKTTGKFIQVKLNKEEAIQTKPQSKLLENNPEEKTAETGFKKVLNKDLYKQKYVKEACDPRTDVCLCDIRATADHIVDVRKTSPRKDFEQYAQNIACYAYKKPPSYLLLEPWKIKVHKRKHQKQRRVNKYFDSVPLKKSLKWDWIRKKRSLSRLGEDNDYDIEQDESNYCADDGNNNSNGNTATKTKIGLIKKHNNVFDSNTDDDFESLYKGEDNVYRTVRKRLKRTARDMKDLAHGLRNLPPLLARENELYAMLGDKISMDCLHSKPYYQKSEHPVFWDAERTDMLAPPNAVVIGPAVILKRVEARHSGNYTCSQNGKTRTVRLTVVTLPQFHVVFIPMYSSKQGCSYDDLRAMQHLGPLMSKESCTNSQNCSSIQIDEPICLEDKDDGSVHLRATAILKVCPPPDVECSAQCRRDLQTAFALLCAANAPVLHSVKVVIARQAYNKTMVPSYGNNRRLIVTHTLRKKDLQKHTEYHQLAASMYPGNLDIVVSCPAGYYLIRKQKICAACPADTYAAAGENTCYSCAAGTSSEPGAARCKLSLRRMRRYDWWWYPPCGYAMAAVGLLCACVVCTVCALLAHVTSRSTARAHAAAVSVARVDSRWTWSRQAAMKRCSSTSAGGPTRGEPPSPSAVILARFFRASASSSRATDSQETKFEQWKEKNIPPPLPPIDFDLS